MELAHASRLTGELKTAEVTISSALIGAIKQYYLSLFAREGKI
jgi:hypothetical protein